MHISRLVRRVKIVGLGVVIAAIVLNPAARRGYLLWLQAGTHAEVRGQPVRMSFTVNSDLMPGWCWDDPCPPGVPYTTSAILESPSPVPIRVDSIWVLAGPFVFPMRVRAPEGDPYTRKRSWDAFASALPPPPHLRVGVVARIHPEDGGPPRLIRAGNVRVTQTW